MRIAGWMSRSVQVPPSAKLDALLLPALYLVNVFIYSAWLQLGQVATKPWLLLVWLYGIVVLVPLLWRDRAPVTVFAAQGVLTVAAWPIMPHYTPIVGIPVALYAVSVYCGKKISLLALLASFVPNELAAAVAFKSYRDLTEQLAAFIGNSVFLTVVAAAAWGAGRLTQAGRLHVRKLEREWQTTREAVGAERRRIARELHDIVSHAVTVIVLQAAGASRVAGTDFGQVTQSLAHIQSTGKQAMAELRRLLGVLEADDPACSAPGVHELGPQPGLADVTVLLTSLRATGMAVTMNVMGTPRDLDPSVDLAAYRIVQEGLTNVLKHAGKDATPRLRLTWQPQDLLIRIDNETNLAAEHRGQALSVGRGLVGLRERAQAVGGQLTAGPRRHGYRLAATLPHAGTAGGVVLATGAGGDQGRVSV
ncbi:MAG: sensor histidine kinase [Pseudonocardiaceae bacterium]